MDNQQGPTLQHMELCLMLCGSLEREEFGGEWIHVYVCVCVYIYIYIYVYVYIYICIFMAESLCYSLETVTTLLISYTPEQK